MNSSIRRILNLYVSPWLPGFLWISLAQSPKANSSINQISYFGYLWGLVLHGFCSQGPQMAGALNGGAVCPSFLNGWIFKCIGWVALSCPELHLIMLLWFGERAKHQQISLRLCLWLWTQSVSQYCCYKWNSSAGLLYNPLIRSVYACRDT